MDAVVFQGPRKFAYLQYTLSTGKGREPFSLFFFNIFIMRSTYVCLYKDAHSYRYSQSMLCKNTW